jgi:mannose-6-phosphate isomerase
MSSDAPAAVRPAPTQPIFFEPLFMERVWGGRRLEQLYGKKLPPGARIGESWEIVDREEAQSVVHDGPLRGQTLHELWHHQRAEIFGEAIDDSPRFPLLVKMLDAQERLSLQVHPPARLAEIMGGEPKTEMWYLAHAEAGADVFAGLSEPTDRVHFEEALHEGRAADLIQRLAVDEGDAIFIPSGRIHAIGAGCLIVEIQQNSDTTYRVFDWNRNGLDGKPRALHIDQSLQATDFNDIQPSLQPAVHGASGELVACPFFKVDKWRLETAETALRGTGGRFAIFTCLEGDVECAGLTFRPGDFFLVPACLPEARVTPVGGVAVVLRTSIPV